MNNLTTSERAAATIVRPPYIPDYGEALISNAGEKFESAFQKCQSELDVIVAPDSENPHHHYKYTSLGGLLSIVRKKMSDNGFTLRQFGGNIKGHGDSTRKWYSLPIITKITHVSSKEYEIFICPVPIEPFSYKNKKTGEMVYTDARTAQAVASAYTSGKRISLLSYWGLATADDAIAKSVQFQKEQDEANDISAEIIATMEECQSQGDLNKWAKENSTGTKLLGEKTAKKIYDRFKELMTDLPAKKPARKRTAKASSDQKDIEEQIEASQ